jgi:hypothetical protein
MQLEVVNASKISINLNQMKHALPAISPHSVWVMGQQIEPEMA